MRRRGDHEGCPPLTYLDAGEKQHIGHRRSVFVLLHLHLYSSIHSQHLLFRPRPLCDVTLMPHCFPPLCLVPAVGSLQCCHPVIPAPSTVHGRTLCPPLPVGRLAAVMFAPGGGVSLLSGGRPAEQSEIGGAKDPTGDLIQKIGEADLLLQNLHLPVPVSPARRGRSRGPP